MTPDQFSEEFVLGLFGWEVVVDEDWTSDKDVSDDGNQELAAPVGGSGVTLVRE